MSLHLFHEVSMTVLTWFWIKETRINTKLLSAMKFCMLCVFRCVDIFTPEEQKMLIKYRKENFAEKDLVYRERRLIGKCPLTPEEVKLQFLSSYPKFLSSCTMILRCKYISSSNIPFHFINFVEDGRFRNFAYKCRSWFWSINKVVRLD